MTRGTLAVLAVFMAGLFLAGCDQTPTTGPEPDTPDGPPIYCDGDPDDIIERERPDGVPVPFIHTTYNVAENRLELFGAPEADELTPELAAWAYRYGKCYCPTDQTTVRIQSVAGRVRDATWGQIKIAGGGGAGGG